MRRRVWMPVFCAVALGMVLAGWYGTAAAPSDKTKASRVVAAMADVRAVPATIPRLESFDARPRSLAPGAAVLLVAAGLALARRPFLRGHGGEPRVGARPSGSPTSLRGPPLLAAL